MILKSFIVIIFLMFALPCRADYIIIPIQDLSLEVPNFEAPKLNLGSSLQGQYQISDIKKEKRNKKTIEKKLINMMYDEYPDAKNIQIINGVMIITLP